jgi:tetratricopeptide (TPR) repeat protein
VSVAVTVLALSALSRGATARPSGFWERAADPDRGKVEALVARAQVELEEREPGVLGIPGAERAEVLLAEALRLRPRHFVAQVMLGEALAAQRRSPEAIAQLVRACGLSRTAEDEAWCTLRLAIERSKAGQYAEAVADYDRHIRLGAASSSVYANSAEVLMAIGRLPEAEERYRQAIRLEEQQPPGRVRDENLALAHYGLGVALDRGEQSGGAREAIGRALQHDPRMELLDPAREARAGLFFVPPGDVHYYRALGFQVAGKQKPALEAYRRYLAEQPGGRWAARAEGHVRELGQALGGEAPPGQGRFRVLAAATVHAEGPIPAPLVDASWKGRARELEACFADVPRPDGRDSARIVVELAVDGRGEVERVAVTLPDAWRPLAPCVEARVRRALRLPRPAQARPTTARLEVVLAIRR